MSDLNDIDRRVAVLEQIAADTRQALIDIRADLRDFRYELRSEMKDIRTEMKDFRSDIRTEMRDLRADINRRLELEMWRNLRWVLGIMLGGFVGLLATMAHGFHWI